MHNRQINQAHHSVHHVHELIHTVFTTSGAAGLAPITPLMQLFPDHFSMVTISGTIVARDQVESLFHRAAGTRPGLTLWVDDLHTVWQDGSTVAVRYREVHQLAGVQTARLSLVIMDVAPSALRWRYLHETALSDKGA